MTIVVKSPAQAESRQVRRSENWKTDAKIKSQRSRTGTAVKCHRFVVLCGTCHALVEALGELPCSVDLSISVGKNHLTIEGVCQVYDASLVPYVSNEVQRIEELVKSLSLLADQGSGNFSLTCQQQFRFGAAVA